MLQCVLADEERNIGIHNLDSDPCYFLPKFDRNRCFFLCSVNIGWSEPKFYIAWVLINFIFFSLGPKTVSEGRVPKASRYRQRTSTVHHTLIHGAREVDVVLGVVDLCISKLELLTAISGLFSLLVSTVVISTPSSWCRDISQGFLDRGDIRQGVTRPRGHKTYQT